MITPQSSCDKLEERLAALHAASLDLVKDISLDPLLKKIAELACRLVDTRYAAVGILDENGALNQFVPFGMSTKVIGQMAYPPVGKGLIGSLMRSYQPIRVKDVTRDPRHAGFPPHHPEMRTFLGVPILNGDKRIGQIYLTDKNNGTPFTQDDERVIQTLAAYASVAVLNSRLVAELHQKEQVLTRRSENLTLLNQLSTTFSSSSDIDEILRSSLNKVLTYIGLEVGEIFVRQEGSNTLQCVCHQGDLVKNIWGRDLFHAGQGVLGGVAKSGKVRIINLLESEVNDLNPQIREQRFRLLACFPLLGRKGAVGVLCVASCQQIPLDELEIQFISAISSWLGTGIENIRLNLQGRRLAILEERERIGMDLHDGIIQSIYAVGLTLDHARHLLKEDPDQSKEKIDKAIDDLDASIRDIRAYILDLRPRTLRNETLLQGITRLVHEFRANTLVDVNLKGPEDGLERLPESKAVALFHICQEALANIGKHAQARHVTIVLWTTRERALLEIQDDGKGFDVEKMQATIGHGLSNMETRAHNAGGDMDIISEPGKGTTVLAWVPFRSKKHTPE
jgi:two-component system sensor histidine kinase DevS